MKKEYRVKKSSEIEMIIRTKKSASNKHFVLYKRENHENTHFRFAVSVSKKYGNAVKRNKMKRQIREIVSRLEIKDNLDIFIVVRPKIPNLSYAELDASLQNLMARQKITR